MIDDLEEQVAKGHRAQAFVNSQEYQDAVKAVYLNLLQQFSITDDMDQVVELKRYLDALNGIDSQLKNFIETGELAQEELNND